MRHNTVISTTGAFVSPVPQVAYRHLLEVSVTTVFWARSSFGQVRRISVRPQTLGGSAEGPAGSGGALLALPLDDADAAAEATRREFAVKAHLARRLASPRAPRHGGRSPCAAGSLTHPSPPLSPPAPQTARRAGALRRG